MTYRTCLVLMVVIAAILSAPTVSAWPPAGAAGGGTLNSPRYRSGELIVKFRAKSAAKAVHRGIGGVVKASMRRLKADLVTLPAGMTLAEGIRQYQGDPNVEYAEPNYLVHKAAIPDDPLYASQWNMLQISAPRAWDSFTGSRGSSAKIVAVLDTGIDYTHPDLVENLWSNPGEIAGNAIDDDGNGIADDYFGASFNGDAPVKGNPMDDDTADSHGTHVAGIIGAVGNNLTGAAGVNWSARLMAVKFLHGPEGVGELADVLKGIEYALDLGATIINCSFEVEEDPSLSAEMKSVRDAIQLADNSGALVISAAGNFRKNLDLENVYPASLLTANNISVAATGTKDLLAAYSDYGGHSVHLAAPGGDGTNIPGGVLSTVMLDSPGGLLLYRTTAGTSMAAPHVAGLAALVWSRSPLLSHYQVKARIFNGVDKLPSLAGKVITGGRINADRALGVADLPAIFSVTPYRALPGMSLSISGANFGATQGGLALAGIPLIVTSWSDTVITATVPPAAVSGELLVNGLGSGFPLSIPAPPMVTIAAYPETVVAPATAFFSPTSGDADNRIVRYEWDLGTGSYTVTQGTGDTVSREFTAPGDYTIRLRVTDDLGQSGQASLAYQVGGSSSGGGGGGGCFIATAAYGSYLHPKVQLLRQFRDDYLLPSRTGRLLVDFYYRSSPPVAEIIGRDEILRFMVRCLLTPLILFIEYPLLALVFSLIALVGRQRIIPALFRKSACISTVSTKTK